MDEKEIQSILLEVLRLTVNEQTADDTLKQKMASGVVADVYRLAKKHDLAHLIGDALDKNGLLLDGTEAKKRFLHERNMAVYRYEQIQYEFEQICDTLEKAEIPLMEVGQLLGVRKTSKFIRTKNVRSQE